MRKKKGMKCICGAIARYRKNLKFNQYSIDGWVCPKCKEIYYNPEQAERILLLNKLKHKKLATKLGQVRSNLIIRIPKDIKDALGFEKGQEVTIKIRDREMRVMPA